jgi:DNA-binding response OmpR family regulator
MSTITLIEDDARIRSALCRALAQRGHSVQSSETAMTGLTKVIEQAPDVVILDLGLPDVDGLELLKMMRAVTAVPVIVLTARDDEAEIVRALDEGADDYLVKPLSAEQLDARVRAVLRRVGHEGQGTIEVGELSVDPRSREATLAGRPLKLTRKEFDLLRYLASRPGVVVKKSELLAEVWRQPYGGGDKTVDVHLSWLRRKLGETAGKPRYLHTVRGVGVKIVDPAD